ncbi:MAG TPA: flippase-like domain-containing protein [candidate division WOR-3 bacterium]|uniref:Flippase-like domain-containing protein n=1 Tax=candidate division WOR-3 bacterium TaxID=2052148 RepID=A0A7V0T5Y2_UNCW3|nr:flippase-like domain-containing protein [candidate division WOR-3 bacterium]
MTPEPAGRASRFPGWLKVALGLAIAAGAMYFLISRLVRDWDKVPWDELQFNYPLLAAAFAVVLFVYLPLFAVNWRILLRTMGERLSLRDALSVLCVSQMGKYVPGKVWFALGRIYLAQRRGVPGAKTAVSMLMETGFALLSAILLFGLSLLLLPAGSVPGRTWLALLLIPPCLVAIYPPVLSRLINWLLARLKRPQVEIRLGFGRILAVLGLYLLMWLTQGVGFYLLIASFYPLGPERLPLVIGSYALAWILGFLSLVTPAGLGVREGILTFALRFAMPEPVAIIAALLGRVWITLAEALAAAAMAPLLRRVR